jgi:hypothetical protein
MGSEWSHWGRVRTKRGEEKTDLRRTLSPQRWVGEGTTEMKCYAVAFPLHPLPLASSKCLAQRRSQQTWAERGKQRRLSQAQWLTTVILATWKQEIRRIAVWSQPSQKVHKNRISNNKKLGTVGHACHPSCTGSINKRTTVQATWAKSENLSKSN